MAAPRVIILGVPVATAPPAADPPWGAGSRRTKAAGRVERPAAAWDSLCIHSAEGRAPHMAALCHRMSHGHIVLGSNSSLLMNKLRSYPSRIVSASISAQLHGQFGTKQPGAPQPM